MAFETYTTGDRDFSAQLTKIKAASPQVIFLPAYYNDVPLIAQQARRLGIREDEIAANAMGVRTREAKILAFVVSSFFGGVAGALFAHQIQFINPSSFDILKSTEILVMVLVASARWPALFSAR